MCQSEEELKNVNSNVKENKKENKVKTEKAVSEVKETKLEPVANDTDNIEPELDWDDSTPF